MRGFILRRCSEFTLQSFFRLDFETYIICTTAISPAVVDDGIIVKINAEEALSDWINWKKYSTVIENDEKTIEIFQIDQAQAGHGRSFSIPAFKRQICYPLLSRAISSKPILFCCDCDNDLLRHLVLSLLSGIRITREIQLDNFDYSLVSMYDSLGCMEKAPQRDEELKTISDLVKELCTLLKWTDLGEVAIANIVE